MLELHPNTPMDLHKFFFHKEIYFQFFLCHFALSQKKFIKVFSFFFILPELIRKPEVSIGFRGEKTELKAFIKFVKE